MSRCTKLGIPLFRVDVAHDHASHNHSCAHDVNLISSRIQIQTDPMFTRT
jgi:hypothetical protein